MAIPAFLFQRVAQRGCMLSPGRGAAVFTTPLRERDEIADGGVEKPAQPNAFTLSSRPHPVQSIVPVPAANQRQAVTSNPEASIETARAVLKQSGPLIRCHGLEKGIVLVRCEGHAIEEGHLFVKHGRIARRRYVLRCGEGQPERVVGHVRAKAIIDTGGQTTIGNIALRDALSDHNLGFRGKPDTIQGATLAIEKGELIDTPAIAMGPIQIRDYGVTFADVYIFKHWKFTNEPAIMIGMDALGTLDTLVIDYRRKELQIRMTKPS